MMKTFMGITILSWVISTHALALDRPGMKACGLPNPDNAISSALSFMKESNLIRLGEENAYVQWGYYSSIKNGDHCLFVMGLCLSEGPGVKPCEGRDSPEAFEVIVYNQKKNAFSLFEKTYRAPKSLKAVIGACFGAGIEGLTPQLVCAMSDSADYPPQFTPYSGAYFVTLEDPESIYAAMKVVMTRIRHHGFSGVARLGVKNAFDPNQNRKWAIVKARFSLRRGMSAEVYDVGPSDLDGLVKLDQPMNVERPRTQYQYNDSYFNTLWNSCSFPKEVDARFRGQFCELMPWVSSYLVNVIR